jgi:glycosyltransferase involved in cell wall biosynthesis
VTSVLILSHEELKAEMSGPSIRNWELAAALSRRHEVTLAVPGPVDVSHPSCRLVSYDAKTLPGLVASHEVVQTYGFVLYLNPVVRQAAHLAIDLYGPFQLEGLHRHEEHPISQQRAMAASDRDAVLEMLIAGDVFLCASERQRDFWLGWMDAAGRVNPDTHEHDPGYTSLLRVVPFGLPETAPQAGPARFRGVIPGISEQDLLVLWGGGIWNWFDPLTLIRAAAATRDSLPELRVLFPGPASPSRAVPRMGMEQSARALSDSLGVTGSRVFFGSGWIPYEQRGSAFLEADIGVSLHREDIETRFSFRTRVLDYLWAGLPVIATEGDSMAELVRSEDLGAVVAYGDVDGVVKALTILAGEEQRRTACARRSAAVARRFRWSVVSEPLMEYCDNPTVASDRGLRPASRREAGLLARDPTLGSKAELGRLAWRTIATLRKEPGSVVVKGREYIRRRRRSGRGH